MSALTIIVFVGDCPFSNGARPLTAFYKLRTRIHIYFEFGVGTFAQLRAITVFYVIFFVDNLCFNALAVNNGQ